MLNCVIEVRKQPEPNWASVPFSEKEAEDAATLLRGKEWGKVMVKEVTRRIDGTLHIELEVDRKRGEEELRDWLKAEGDLARHGHLRWTHANYREIEEVEIPS